MKRTSSEFKRLAKGSLLGRYGLPVGVCLLANLILLAINSGITVLFPTTNTLSWILYVIAAFIVQLLSAVLLVGPSVVLLDMSRGGQGRLGDLFYSFRHQPDRILLSQFLIGLMEIACMVPAIVVSLLSDSLHLPVLLILSALFLVLGIAGIVWITLNYSLVLYLYIDCPQKSVRQLMRESKMLMHGNRGRYFYLKLSFVGLYLLSMVSCFLGMLWLNPYMEMTTLQFYREVIGEI